MLLSGVPGCGSEATQPSSSEATDASAGGASTGATVHGGASSTTGGSSNGGTVISNGGVAIGMGGSALGAAGTSSTVGGAGGSLGLGVGGGAAGTAGTGGAASVGPSMSAGCGTAPTLTAGTEPVAAGYGDGGRLTIQSGGESRSFIIRLPDNYDPSQPYWLIFGYHWNGGLADDVDSGGTSQYDFSYYGLQKLSQNGAIFVAPQGINNGWENPGGRDLTFTDDMVQMITNDLCVDTTHIISTGFSYGAGMSYALACARASVFDAVVLYEGAQLSGCEGGNDPIAYMQLAGLADDITRIDWARPMRNRFVTNNGCTPQDPPEPPAGSLTHICTSYTACSAGHPVRWCAHGSGHTPAPVDGDPTLIDGVNTWTPPEVWSWLTSL